MEWSVRLNFVPYFCGRAQESARAIKINVEKKMYAVIRSGGKQHRVVEGEILNLEKIDIPAGESVDFDQVLMVGDDGDVKIGAPCIDGAKVSAEVVEHGRGDKIKVVKFRRRKHSRTTQGHRQWYTKVKITSISSN